MSCGLITIYSHFDSLSLSIARDGDSQLVKPWEESDTKTSTILNFYSGELRGHDIVYVNIRCSNLAGLYSYFHSGPIHVITSPPDLSILRLYVMTQSMTSYSTRDSYQADTGGVLVGWTGYSHIDNHATLQVIIN